MPMNVQTLRIISAAAAGGRIVVRGNDFAFLVRDDSGATADIAVETADDLRELVPALRPASIALDCTDAERPALTALVDSIRTDRRVIEARH